MDIDLGPGIPGDHAAEQILEIRHLPVVFLTSHTEREYVERVKEITRYGYVIKNSGEFVLWDTIEVAFELFEANEELERFFSVNLDLLCIADSEGNFIKVNQAWEDVLGYSIGELTRSKFLDFVHPDDVQSTIDAMERLSEQEEVIDFVNRYRSKDGGYRSIEWRSHPSGNLIYAAARDMTERFEYETALQDSERAYRNLFERAPIGIFRTDSHGKPLAANMAMAHILGLESPEQALDRYTDLGSELYLRPERRAEFIDELERDGYVHGFEYEALPADGRRIWLSMNARKTELDPNDGFVIEGFAVDVTERKRTEEAIMESENRFRSLVENAPDAIFVQTNGNFSYMNQAALELFGAEELEELLGTPVVDRFHPDHRESVRQRIRKLNEERIAVPRIEETCLRVDDSEVPAEVSAAPLDYRGETGALVFVRDVTKERELERMQREAADEYETVFNGTQDAMFLINVERNRFTYIRNNRAHREMTGLSLSDIRRRTPKELLGEEAGTAVENHYQACVDAKAPISYQETLDLPKGERSWATTLTPVIRNGQVEEIVGSAQDITDQKHSEVAIKRYAQWLELTMSAANMAWWQMDVKTGALTFDEQKTRMLGYTAEGFDHYESFTNLLHPEDQEKAMEAMRRHLEGSTERYEVEYRIQRSSGEYIWFYDVGAVIARDAEGRPARVAGIVMDVSDRKHDQERIEALLREKDLLLKEVHHRIKNNMHTMMSLMSLEGQETENPEVARVLQDARGRLQSMEVLYERLFQSGQYQEMLLSDYLPPLIDDMVRLSPKGAGVTVTKSVEPIRMDVKSLSSLGLIVTELVTNALKHGFRGRREGTILVSVARSDGRATLTVKDDGNGPPEKKQGEEAKGFGITLINALADQLGGSFRIENENGARAIVEFPIREEETA